jgi:hypothetical protein
MRPREKEILMVLTNCVRAMTLQQLSRTWWTETPWGLARTRAVVHEMASAGWLEVRDVLSRPVRPLEKPLITWTPSDDVPDFTDLSKNLHSRAMVPAETVSVVFSTKKSVSLLGRGTLPPVKLTQMTHDLNVSEVFLAYRLREMEDEWVGEDQFPHWWPIGQRPDAVLRQADGTIHRAIEYGGDYSPERLAALHGGLAGCFGTGLCYEIW